MLFAINLILEQMILIPLDHRACLVASLQVLGHDRYSVLGWSDGGIIGIIMAATYPDHVQKLLVWGGNAYFTEKDIQAYEGMYACRVWLSCLVHQTQALLAKSSG